MEEKAASTHLQIWHIGGAPNTSQGGTLTALEDAAEGGALLSLLLTST